LKPMGDYLASLDPKTPEQKARFQRRKPTSG